MRGYSSGFRAPVAWFPLFLLLLLTPFSFAMTIQDPFHTLHENTPAIIASYIHKGTTNTFDSLSTSSSPHITIDRRIIDHQDNNNRFDLELKLTAHEGPIELEQLEFVFHMDIENTVMMADGFQCWTHSRELDKHGSISSISRTVAWWTQFDLQGDYNFYQYSGQVGVIHSNSYTYFRNANTTVFVGSLSESSGYTYFKADIPHNRFTIYKDIQGKRLAAGESLELRYLVTQHTDLNVMWQQYAQYYYGSSNALQQQQQQQRHLTGWSSWYNYYERVTEEDVVRVLEAFKSYDYKIDVLQIDDGYQRAIGDWLDVDTQKFPRGMHYLAREISEAGYIPGLWLAPYAVGFKSRLAKEHPDWLLRDGKGNVVVAGPNWGGFYALDIYNPEARAYLQQVFDQVLHDWGYRLLKLDFIFAAAMIPRLGKTRGEIVWDAVTLLNELTQGRALLLGSGVPLAATWGRLDYCRISSDASPFWDHTVLRLAHVRERVATHNALMSTLHRWPMKHVFGTDPDVFFLRSNDNKLTPDERFTTCTVNMIIGQLTLMSDDITKYNAIEHQLYASTFPKVHATIQQMIPIGPDVFRLDYTCNKRRYISLVNLSPVLFKTKLPLDETVAYYFFEQKNPLVDQQGLDDKVAWYKPEHGDEILLRPHETRSFMYITDHFAGSTGHFVPGWDIETWDDQQQDQIIRITLRKNIKTSAFNIWFTVDDGVAPTVFVDDTETEVTVMPLDKSGIHLAKCSIQQDI